MLIEEALIRQEVRRLDSLEPRSRENDKQVLALAVASQAQVMVVRDGRLRKDFEDARLVPAEPGSRRRAYPVGQPPARRNDFLHRRRCPKRRLT